MIPLTTVIRLSISVPKPWAIGSFSSLYADDPVQTDGEQTVRLPIQRREGASVGANVHLPASSLVGGLRSHFGEDAETWLGPASFSRQMGASATTQKDAKKPAPSRLRCLGAVVSGAEIGERTTTQISSETRAALGRTLRTAEHVAPGASIKWWITWDHSDFEHDELDGLLQLMAGWRPVIGRGRGVDQGWAVLTKVESFTVDRRTPDHLTWWLSKRQALLSRTSGVGIEPPGGWSATRLKEVTPKGVTLGGVYEVVDALHLGDGSKEVENGRGNVLSCMESIHATSWKGIFRHRAEYILRIQGAPDDDRALVDRLFGSGRTTGASEDGGTRGKLRFATSPVTVSRHEDRHLPKYTQVSIDRVSGGSLRNSKERPEHGSLFGVRYIPAGSRFELRIHSEEPLDAEESAVINAVFRDLDDGVIGVGGMTTRGFGTVRRDGDLP